VQYPERARVPPQSPGDHAQLQHAIAAAKHSLGPATAAAVWVEGQTMAGDDLFECVPEPVELEVSVPVALLHER